MPTKLKLGTHVDNGWMYRVYQNHGVRLFLLIHPFISFFFFSNFQTSKRFAAIFSGTVRHTQLKLGTHVDSG